MESENFAEKYPFLSTPGLRYVFAHAMFMYLFGEDQYGDAVTEIKWTGADFHHILSVLAVDHLIMRGLTDFKDETLQFNRTLFLALAAMIDEPNGEPTPGYYFLEDNGFRRFFASEMRKKAAKIDEMQTLAEGSLWTVMRFNDTICDLIVDNVLEADLCRFSNDSIPFAKSTFQVLYELIEPTEWNCYHGGPRYRRAAEPKVDRSRFTLIDGMTDAYLSQTKIDPYEL